ncbi:high nitrogen upregulated cytochrome P450 monooxygenase 2 [Russula earlei]|uniref:High nitrogen upregulated cytochrome P450 monooxygenase 2 n=1 Tax=Russula earlei TaxID=71964 RepID=A0ACC0U799_9AGAM|nr:high nitrogen upregulated cytochrome P450 monooxygenase 2 [Russula earlei]
MLQVSSWLFRRFEPRSVLPRVALLIVIPALLSFPISSSIQRPYIALPFVFFTYWAGSVFFTLAYRLSPFHPLAQHPGPLIHKLSKWWAAYISFRGDQHRYYKRLHDRYGDVVRIGPNELSICDASLIHSVLGQDGLPKGPRWDGRTPTLLAQRDPVKHLHLRKPWNRAFSSAALKEYEVILASRTRQLVNCLGDLVHESGRNDGAVLDIAAWFIYFSTDFMGDMAFGGGFELMEAGGDTDGVLALIESGLRISGAVAHVPYVMPFLAAVRGKKDSMQRSRTFGRERVLKRLEIGAIRKDLFYYLSGEGLPESDRPSVNEVAQNGLVAIIAGSDTTRSTLTAVIYYLLLNRAAYERLQEEVDSAFPSGEEPLGVLKLSQMEWLNGCINEALRLQPPVPSGSQRSVNKGKGAKVLGKLVIPEETQLFLHTYSIHRDRRYFHAPEAFLPERWLSKGAPAGEHNTAAFIPFSYGPAGCAGKNLGLMEMRIVLCWVLRRFQFSKVPRISYEEWEGKFQDWFVMKVDPLPVNVSIRNV